MTPAQQDKARRLVDLPGWQWLAGMRLVGRLPRYPVRLHDGERPFDTMEVEEEGRLEWWTQPEDMDGGPIPGPYLPDLLDAATAGLLLQMVPGLGSVRFESRVTLDAWWGGALHRFHAPTLGEAAADALLAAGRCQHQTQEIP